MIALRLNLAEQRELESALTGGDHGRNRDRRPRRVCLRESIAEV